MVLAELAQIAVKNTAIFQPDLQVHRSVAVRWLPSRKERPRHTDLIDRALLSRHEQVAVLID